mmetsp:Transcript_6937/g.14465  ORF Transcript_6937/g.14465 Transcript_6937/m.14465 type:complete len:745 (-) Transcript_6937:156-2390(-)
MTERYDEVERRFGIAAYASPHEGFAAVVKARYSDFIVHEVDMNGNIARLENLQTQPNNNSSPKCNEQISPSEIDTIGAKKRKHEETIDLKFTCESENNDDKATLNDNNPTNEDPSAADWENCLNELKKVLEEDPSNDIVAFLKESSASSYEGDKKFHMLAAIPDKQKRRSVHQLMKSTIFSSVALADTREGRIRVWHKKFEGDMPPDTFTGARGGGDKSGSSSKNGVDRGGKGKNNKNNKGGSWPADRPDFLRFVLYKENIDTSTAAKDVVRMARLNPKRGISFAGMKDKRGVTSQFCSTYRIEKEQLLAVNKTHEMPGFSGGGNTSSKGAGVLRVGNLSYSSDEVRLGSLGGNRFDIVLRNVDFGYKGTLTKEIVREKLGTAAKALQDVGFINYFGMQRFGKSNDTHEVGIAILKGDFKSAVEIIMREKNDENSQRVAEARKTWANRFVGIDVKNNENAAKDAEMKCAKSIQTDMGRFMVCEKSIVSTLARKPRDYKRAFSSIAKNMRSMFLHAYQSYLWNKVASHRIKTGGSSDVQVGDLVLIEDKSLKEGGGGTSGLKGKAVKVLDAEDVKGGKYSISDVVLPLVGSKIIYPKGSSGEHYDELLKKDDISKADFSKIGNIDKEISLSGDYRKLMCKPSDVTFEIKAYQDPYQPLMQTDLMQMAGTEITAATITEVDQAKEESKRDPENIDSTTLFGMVIGFTLPPSSYATIALRELTKRPTASDYQSKLEVSGKCERNIEK